MTYAEFLEACRLRAGIETKSEMARRLGSDPKYYINMTNGFMPPGRELLEQAAKVANLSFEDCIRFPDEASPDPEKAADENVFSTIRRALKNWKRPRVIEICYDIETWKRPPQHVKRGGRKRRPD